MRWAWLVLTAAACGRWNFADRTDGALGSNVGDSGSGGPADAPGIPASICRADRTMLADVPATTDLAIAATPAGFAVMYTNTAGAVTGMTLDPQRQLLATRTVPTMTGTSIGGLADAGTKLAVATHDTATQSTTVWSVPPPRTWIEWPSLLMIIPWSGSADARAGAVIRAAAAKSPATLVVTNFIGGFSISQG